MRDPGYAVSVAAILAVAGAVALPATAAGSVFRVTVAQHTSSSQKAETGYSGRSTSSWRLARATTAAPNRLEVRRVGRLVAGSAMVNVTGAYTVAVTTDRPGHCAFTSRTGDTDHPLTAPGRLMLSVGPHPDDARKTAVSFTGVHATLANPYLGSECTTSVSGEPGPGETSLRTVPRTLFQRKRFTLRFTGATSREGVTYRWATTFRFVRRL